MGRLLMIVSRYKPDLFQSLSREFAVDREAGRIEIILDRRQCERRARTDPRPHDRRRQERRSVALPDLQTLGWAMSKQVAREATTDDDRR